MTEAKISQKNQIVIPKEAREAMRVKAGDRLIVRTFQGLTLLLPKPKDSALRMRGLAKGLYPKNYLKTERKGWLR